MSQPFAAQLENAFVRCRDMDAPLAERLKAFADTVRRLGPHFQDAVDRLVSRLKAHEVGDSAPRPGEPMPPFVLPDETGKFLSMEQLLEHGPAAITFHRGHWCPYCRINTAALAEAQQEVAEEGGQIVAIIPERQQFASELKAEAQATFPILLDTDNGYALSLNLAFWIDDDMRQLISSAGWDIPRYQGSEAWLLPVPATFVVGKDGMVVERFVDPDYRKRMAIEDLLAALKAAN